MSLWTIRHESMIPNAGFWEIWFREKYVHQIEAFQANAFKRIASAFRGIEAEADAKAEAEYERLGSMPADPDSWTDMSDLADLATEHGVVYYETMSAVRQSIVNLLGVGLHHLFEQQQHLFFRREPAVGGTRNFTMNELEKRLREYGIDTRSFGCAARVRELRLSANTIKHGAGRSADELARIRPDLFRDPVLEQPMWAEADASSARGAYRPLRIAPLAGADVRVSEHDLTKWSAAVISYWKEFAAILDRQSQRSVDD